MKAYYTQTYESEIDLTTHHFVIKFKETTYKTPFKLYMKMVEPDSLYSTWFITFDFIDIYHTNSYLSTGFAINNIETVFKYYDTTVFSYDRETRDYYKAFVENKPLFNSLINTMKTAFIKALGV